MLTKWESIGIAIIMSVGIIMHGLVTIVETYKG